jgi:hypothetical protein
MERAVCVEPKKKRKEDKTVDLPFGFAQLIDSSTRTRL